MNFRVAVDAAFIAQTVGIDIRLILTVRRGRMPAADVAALTKDRGPRKKHILVVRAVRIMTRRAVFPRRSVIPHKRSAFILMALITRLRDRIFNQKLIGYRAVGIMTCRAAHFAFDKRHVTGFPNLRFFIRVALIAGFGRTALLEEGGFPMIDFIVTHERFFISCTDPFQCIRLPPA
jgi:hypothetical protein